MKNRIQNSYLICKKYKTNIVKRYLTCWLSNSIFQSKLSRTSVILPTSQLVHAKSSLLGSIQIKNRTLPSIAMEARPRACSENTKKRPGKICVYSYPTGTFHLFSEQIQNSTWSVSIAFAEILRLSKSNCRKVHDYLYSTTTIGI